MKTGIKIFSIVGIALFLLILSRINLNDLVNILAHTNVLFLFLAFLVTCITIILKSLKWKIIVNSVKPSFSLRESIVAFFVGFSFSTITPAKLGDFVKVLYVADENCSLGKALSTVVIDRLIDIILLVSIALIGIYGFSVLYHIDIISISAILLVVLIIIAGAYVVLNKQVLSALLKPFFNFFVPQHLKNKLSMYYNDFFTGMYSFYNDRFRFFSSIFIGIVSWIPPFFYGYLLARSIGIDIDIFFFVLAIPVMGLIDVLPISISGIGTRDMALIFLFGLKSISAELAVAFSLLYLFMSYWLTALIGVGVYFKYPVKIPEEMS